MLLNTFNISTIILYYRITGMKKDIYLNKY